MALLAAQGEGLNKRGRDALPAHLLIKIEPFSLFWDQRIRIFESNEFVAGDHKWRLAINGDGDYLSVYLSIVGASSLPLNWEINAVFSFFLLNQLTDKYVSFGGQLLRFYAMNYQRGYHKLISKQCLTDPSYGYVVDDSCVMGAEVLFVIKSERVTDIVSLKATAPFMKNWNISKFSTLEGVWTSEDFYAHGYKWRTTLHPNGCGFGGNKGRSISIYLELVDSKSIGPHQKVDAGILIRLKSKLLHSTTRSHCCQFMYNSFTSSVTYCGYADFISIADMRDPKKGFLVNDCCELEIEISIQAVVENSCTGVAATKTSCTVAATKPTRKRRRFI